MRKIIEIAGLQFKTKKELQSHVRNILHAGGIPTEQQFLQALLARHPHAAIKIGCGVEYIFVRTNYVHGRMTQGFWIHRTNGTESDFSYLECITPSLPRAKVLAAMRHAVQDSVLAFKEAAFDKSPVLVCPFTGESLTLSNCHVDHAPPDTFLAIAEDFVSCKCLDWDTIKVTEAVGDGVLMDELTDTLLSANWIAFHNNRASLRIVSPTANLSHIKRGSVA